MAVIGVIQDNLYKSRANIAIKRIKKKCSGLPVMIHQVSEIRGYNSTYALLNAVVIRDADIVVVELDRLNDIRLKYPDISENISIAAVLKAGNPGNVPVSYTHLRAHETDSYLVCRLLLEKKKKTK